MNVVVVDVRLSFSIALIVWIRNVDLLNDGLSTICLCFTFVNQAQPMQQQETNEIINDYVMTTKCIKLHNAHSSDNVAFNEESKSMKIIVLLDFIPIEDLRCDQSAPKMKNMSLDVGN